MTSVVPRGFYIYKSRFMFMCCKSNGYVKKEKNVLLISANNNSSRLWIKNSNLYF
jgi:hypothetical protein